MARMVHTRGRHLRRSWTLGYLPVHTVVSKRSLVQLAFGSKPYTQEVNPHSFVIHIGSGHNDKECGLWGSNPDSPTY